MKVRVERIRRGRRTAEVEYVETAGPRRRRAPDHAGAGVGGARAWEQEQEAPRGGLRLPWQIKADRK